MHTLALHRGLLTGSVAAFTWVAIMASPTTCFAATKSSRFSLSETIAVQSGALALSGSRFQLRGNLQNNGPMASLKTGAFTLAARLATQPLTCTNDTIFADGFDG